MSLTLNELKKAYPGEIAYIPVETLFKILQGKNPVNKKVTKADILLALADAGEAGLTLTDLHEKVSKLKKQVKQEVTEILFMLESLEDYGKVWHEEIKNGDCDNERRYYFTWER